MPLTTVPDPPPFSKAGAVPKHDPAYIQAHYPSYLQLQLVQVFHRHGERTPESIRFTSVVPKVWNACQHGNLYHRQFIEAMHRYAHAHPATAEEADPHRPPQPNSFVPFRPSPEQGMASGSAQLHDTKHPYLGRMFMDYAKGKVPSTQDISGEKLTAASCAYGQLTDIGRDSLTRLGAAFRNIYVDQLGYLPHLHTNPNQMYLRCSEYTRTFESLHQLLTGLYPEYSPEKVAGTGPGAAQARKPFTIHVRPRPQETLIADLTCPRLRQFFKSTMSQSSLVIAPQWDQFLESHVYPSAIGKDVRAIREKGGQYLQTHQVYDTLVALQAHNMPLPRGITPATVDKLEKFAVHEWMHGMVRNIPYLRILIGRLMNQVMDQMRDKILLDRLPSKEAEQLTSGSCPRSDNDHSHPRELKLSVWSGHDSTMLPILAIFDSHTDQWVPYASNITLELFKDGHLSAIQRNALRQEGEVINEANSKRTTDKFAVDKALSTTDTSDFFVRVRYNDDFITIKECAEANRHHPDMGPSMCTFAAFNDVVRKYIPKDYRTECLSLEN